MSTIPCSFLRSISLIKLHFDVEQVRIDSENVFPVLLHKELFEHEYVELIKQCENENFMNEEIKQYFGKLDEMLKVKLLKFKKFKTR